MKASQSPPDVSLLQLLRFTSLSDRFCLLFGSLLAIITGFSWNLLTIVFGDAVDVFVEFESAQRRQHSSEKNLTNFNNNGTQQEVEWQTIEEHFSQQVFDYCSYLFVIWIANTLLNTMLLVLFPLAAKNQILTIKKKYFRALLRQDKHFFDNQLGGDFASRVTSDLKRVEDGLGEKLGLAVYHVSTAVIAVGTAFLYGWQLTLIILSLLPLLAFGTTIMNKVQATMARKEVEAYSAAGTVAEETISAIRTVFAFCQTRQEVQRYSRLLEPSLKSGIRRNFLTGMGNGLMFLCLYSGLALGIFFGVQLLLADPLHYSLGTIVIVFWCVSGAGFSIGGAAPHLEAIRVAKETARQVYHVIQLEPKIDPLSQRGLKPDKVNAEIEFREVHFRYPVRPEVAVLQGFSLRIRSGESVALVGPSGGGKSTVVQLLQRFYDPLEGAVLFDGHDLRDWHLGHLRAQIGTVGQEPQLFDATVRENIRLGSLTEATPTRVEKAALEANAHHFVTSLPLQYETRVGDRGTQLSGGQKQRLAIARALIREPKLLLLDEATSALDLQSEALVQQSLELAARGRTTVIVAHRLSTVVNCDKIVYIEDGRVVEEGTHLELMAKEGKYFALVRRQQLTDQIAEGSEPEEDSRPESKAEREDAEDTEVMAGSSVEEQEEEVLKKFSSWRLWRMLWIDKYFLASGLLLSLLYGLIVPIYAFIFGQFVEVFVTSVSNEEIWERSHVFAYYYVVLALSVGFIAVSQMTLLGVASERLTLRLRKLAFDAIMRQEMAWFDRPENASGALCARLSSDAANVQGASGSRMAIILQALATFLTSAVLGFCLNFQLALIAGIFTPLILVGANVSASVDTWQSKHARNSLEESTKVASEALTNIGTVQALQKEKHFADRFDKIIDRDNKNWMWKCVLRALTLAFCLSVVFLSYAVVFLFGGHLARQSRLRSSDLFIIIETMIYGSMTVGQSSVFTSDYRKAKLAAANIFRLIDRKSRQQSGSLRPQQPLEGNIRFRNVHFSYPSRQSHPVLSGLNLEVTSGQTVALVGASGCGKSTCVQLLEKFYSVHNSGDITIDGKRTEELDTEWLRNQVALVSQEPSLFSMTIRENIEYGLQEGVASFQQVVRAAQLANIHGFISELPKAYDTRVGPKGTQLSGGQRQRLAIARALIREPKILLLDEATSALDTESEKVVQEALEEAMKGRTSLVIAHRLSTVRNAHKICVLRRGRVVEEGSHEELMTRKGVYYQLYNYC